MSFLRTVLGDIPAGQAGVCYAHEHIIIDPSFATFTNPDFLLDSIEAASVDLQEFRAAGGKTIVDSMPCSGGRNATKLAELSKRTGANIVCPTGLHLEKLYPPGHWGERISLEEMTQLFIAEIEQGIDAADCNGPNIVRTKYRAGVIKIATGLNKINDRQRKIIEAAAAAHHATGAPLLTHTEQGTAALEQIHLFQELKVPLEHVCISHTDRRPDPVYHREILSTGVFIEYDSAFRWPKTEEKNPTLQLTVQMFEEGYGSQIMLGMDAARRKYWHGYQGTPGLAFLLTEFVPILLEAGLRQSDINMIFVCNPATCYAFSL